MKFFEAGKHMFKRMSFCCLIVLLFSSAHAFWAEETFSHLSRDEKIGQLFMIAVRPLLGSDHLKKVESLIIDYHVGNIIIFKTDPQSQVALINYFQGISTLPLMVGQDCEWGLAMRLENTIAFPKNITLGAITDDKLMYQVGYEIGKQCGQVGVHINFAPVVDINSNPLNPVIGIRSFGDDKKNVAQKGVAFMCGMQDAGVLACAKHFPGHGDTNVDSHVALPVIKHNLQTILDEDIYPFKALIDAGVASVMIAHLEVPALQEHCPATLSPNIITTLLRHKLNFNGLIVSDAFEMKGLSRYYTQENAVLQALKAGIDLIVCPENVPDVIAFLRQAIDEGKITQKEIDEHVLRILRYKEMLKLNESKKCFVEEKNIIERLNTETAQHLKYKLYQAALTSVTNTQQLIPLQKNKKSVGVIAITNKHINYDFSRFGAFKEIQPIFDNEQALLIINNFKHIDTIIVFLASLDQNTSMFSPVKTIASSLIDLFNQLNTDNKKLVFVVCTSPYALQFLQKEETVLIAYEYAPETIDIALDAVFGRIIPNGKMPIN